MIALAITRTIVVVILLSSSMKIRTYGPHLHTQFVDMGQFYPRADFANVLIDLYVDLAITRSKAAFNLTNHSYHRPTQINWQKDRGK